MPPAIETTTPPDTAAPPPALTPGEGVVPPQNDEGLVAAMEATYLAAGKSGAALTYGQMGRRYVLWLKSKALTLREAPEGTAIEWLNTLSPAQSKFAASALRAIYAVAQNVGYTVAPQTIKPRKKEPQTVTTPAAVIPDPNGPAVNPGPIVFGSSQQSVEDAVARANGTNGLSGAPAVAPPLSRPAGIQRPPNGSTQRQQPVLPSLGGRVRISKRIDGYEGTGAPIGTRAVLGDYTLDDVEVEGSVMKFILNALRPHFGPKIGQPAATYYVERLDNIGNPMQGSLQAIPVFPDVAMGGMGVTGPQAQPAPAVPAPAPAAAPVMAPATEESFLRYLMDDRKRSEEKYDKLLEEVRAGNVGKGMDPMTLQLLLDRAKPPPLDVEAALAAFRRANPPPPPAPPPAPIMAPTPLAGLGLGGLDFAMPPPREDKVVDSLLGQIKDLGQQVREMAQRAVAPPPPPPPPDPMAMFTAMLGAMKALAPAPPPPDPVKDALIQTALQSMGKTKTLAETLQDMSALQQFMGGDRSGPSLAEVAMTALENIDKIGAAIGAMKPPTLPTRPAPAAAQPAAPAATPAAPAKPSTNATQVLPDAAKQAFLRLVKTPPGEEHDQEIVEAVYALLQALYTAGGDWKSVAERVTKTYLSLDTKPEILAIVTQLFTWCGAKRIMSEDVLNRITRVLHTHYTLIYGAMTGGQTRSLKDAPSETPNTEGAPAPSGEQPAEAAPVATVEGESVESHEAAEVGQCDDCGHPGHGEEPCGYCKPDAECAQPGGDEGEDEEEDDEADGEDDTEAHPAADVAPVPAPTPITKPTPVGGTALRF